jgi:hypothetical protein
MDTSKELLSMLEWITTTGPYLDYSFDTRQEIEELIKKAKKEFNPPKEVHQLEREFNIPVGGLNRLKELIDQADVWNELYVIGPDFDKFSTLAPTEEIKDQVVLLISDEMTISELEEILSDYF